MEATPMAEPAILQEQMRQELQQQRQNMEDINTSEQHQAKVLAEMRSQHEMQEQMVQQQQSDMEGRAHDPFHALKQKQQQLDAAKKEIELQRQLLEVEEKRLREEFAKQAAAKQAVTRLEAEASVSNNDGVPKRPRLQPVLTSQSPSQPLVPFVTQVYLAANGLPVPQQGAPQPASLAQHEEQPERDSPISEPSPSQPPGTVLPPSTILPLPPPPFTPGPVTNSGWRQPAVPAGMVVRAGESSPTPASEAPPITTTPLDYGAEKRPGRIQCVWFCDNFMQRICCQESKKNPITFSTCLYVYMRALPQKTVRNLLLATKCTRSHSVRACVSLCVCVCVCCRCLLSPATLTLTQCTHTCCIICVSVYVFSLTHLLGECSCTVEEKKAAAECEGGCAEQHQLSRGLDLSLSPM